MKKNLKYIIPIIIFIVILFVVFILNKDNEKYAIPSNYIAVFHGGTGEITYETYIYKIENKNDNYGFKYINVTSKTISWGSSEWKHEITGKGKFDWTDDAFKVAKENGAYSYVTIPNDKKNYTIEEFQDKFLMN